MLECVFVSLFTSGLSFSVGVLCWFHYLDIYLRFRSELQCWSVCLFHYLPRV